jgi:hypothetical protein
MKLPMLASLLILLLGYDQRMEAVTDSVSTWYEAPRVTSNRLNTVIAVDSMIAVAAGWDGTIIRTTNQGVTWSVVKNDSIMDFTSLISNRSGDLFMIGNDYIKTGAHTWDGVFTSTDQGKTWSKVSDTPLQYLFHNPFDNTIWGLAQNSYYISSDNCKTWKKQELPTGNDLRHVGFYRRSTIYVAGSNGTLFYTSNGGNSWSRVAQGVYAKSLKSICIVGDTVVVTGGDYDGVVLVSKVGQDAFVPVVQFSYPYIHAASYSGRYWWFLREAGVFYRSTVAKRSDSNGESLVFEGWSVDPSSIAWFKQSGVGHFVTKNGRTFSTRNHGAAECNIQILKHPEDMAAEKMETVRFSIDVNDPSASVLWQTKIPGLDWISLSNGDIYRDVTSLTMSVRGISTHHHNQLFRAIVQKYQCRDTSETALLALLDTCITIQHDTVTIAVADTLIIGINTSAESDGDDVEVLVYPNPAHTVLNIECRDFAELAGYSYEVLDVLGKEMHRGQIMQQHVSVPIASLGSPGLCYLYIRDVKGSVVANKKLLIK